MDDNSSAFGVAIVGCGTVGGATAALLTQQRSALDSKVSPRIDLRYIVDVDFTIARGLGLDEALFCDDLDKALSDPGVSAVVELVGGTTIARDIIERALRAGKHVVTANKALLAHHGTELYALARENGVCVSFEASCGGGIPIVRALCDGLIANRIEAMYGIVNGTCNYILTAMTRRDEPYADALAQAQQAGLAEADPTLDVAGVDSAHKLAILASLAFGTDVDFESIPVEGIDTLELTDVENGQELGYVIKLLVIAHMQEDGLTLRVRPAFITKNHPMAWVSGPFNAISVYGDATGHTMYYGRGAGGMPTASAVVADLASTAMGTAPIMFDQLKVWPDRNRRIKQLPIDDVISRFYLRLVAQDKPDVLARVASILGHLGISINSVLQHEQSEDGPEGRPVQVVITTHAAREGDVRQALAQVDALDVIQGDSVCIAIIDEHPEGL